MRPDGFDRELGPGGLEVRTTPATLLEARSTKVDPPIIVGFGSVYGRRATIRGFWDEWDEEVIEGAWAETIRSGDIRAMFNHDPAWLLGRTSAGTLRLEDRPEGLHYEIDINPDDPNAMSVHAKVARGDVSGSSVWFRVVKEQWTEPDESNDLERPLRQILQAQLFEVGPVVFPAFPQTTSAARAAVEGMLSAAGVTSEAKRAKWAYDLTTADAASAEKRIRELFARSPALREAVCTCGVEAAAGTPQAGPSASAGGPPQGPSRPHPVALHQKQLEWARRAHHPHTSE